MDGPPKKPWYLQEEGEGPFHPKVFIFGILAMLIIAGATVLILCLTDRGGP